MLTENLTKTKFPVKCVIISVCLCLTLLPRPAPTGAAQQPAAVVLRPRPCTVTSSLLREARLLRQVDSKFIVVVSGGLLLMVDQHAASERVRLETLLREARAEGGGIAPETLPSPLELVLPAKTVLPLTECPGAAAR